MQQIILQGPDLEPTEGHALADELNAELNIHQDYYVLKAHQPIDADRLQTLRDTHPFDINPLPEDFDPHAVKLVISDMDSTLINIECVDEIADFAGVKAEVSAITEAAMRGELDFAGSLTERVALLKGLSTSVLQTVYDERLGLNPGAEQMLGGLRNNGIKFALVSGGFTFFTDRLKKRLDLDFTLANVLEKESGYLTGKVEGSIVGADRKAQFLQELCDQMGISPKQAVAIGDGANDLKMLGLAGLGIAYHAKPKVQAQADCALNHCGLEGVLGLLNL